MPTRSQPAPVSSRRPRTFVWLLAVVVLGGVIFLAVRHRPNPVVPLTEMHRTNLVMQAGRWFAPGQTNGFTGILTDTYEDGAVKSRSAVSNGLLHGLSQGWHTNGQQQVEENYSAGTSDGLRIKWHPNGEKLSEVMVVTGQLQGTFRSWHENGMPAEEVELKDGQSEGVSRAWYPSGFLKSKVSLREGKVIEQKFWKDGEFKDPPTATPSIAN